MVRRLWSHYPRLMQLASFVLGLVGALTGVAALALSVWLWRKEAADVTVVLKTNWDSPIAGSHTSVSFGVINSGRLGIDIKAMAILIHHVQHADIRPADGVQLPARIESSGGIWVELNPDEIALRAGYDTPSDGLVLDMTGWAESADGRSFYSDTLFLVRNGDTWVGARPDPE